MLQSALLRARVNLSMAIYLAFVALICSFILFEVLDVDGSDFHPPTRSGGTLQASDHSDDLRRLCLQSTGLTWLETATPRPECGHTPLGSHRLIEGGAVPPAIDPLLYPVPLARSSLPRPLIAA